MTVVYVRYNDSRAPRYQLVTSVEEADGGRYSLKRAASGAAAGFRDSLLDKYRLLAVEDFPLKPLEPTADGDGVRFEYLSGESLDFPAGQAVRAGDGPGVKAVFATYRGLIDQMAVTGSPPGDNGFSEFFGDPGAAAGMKHLATGCLDLILENIYRDGDGYALIDYEWTFDFPLPRSLVLLRTVMNTYYKYHAYNINQLLPAGGLLADLGVDAADTGRLLKMEWNFQKAVNARVQPFAEFQALYDRVLYQPFEGEATIGHLREQAEQLAGIEVELEHARRQLIDRENEVASMRASKFWKLRESYVALRRLAGRVRRKS